MVVSQITAANAANRSSVSANSRAAHRPAAIVIADLGRHNTASAKLTADNNVIGPSQAASSAAGLMPANSEVASATPVATANIAPATTGSGASRTVRGEVPEAATSSATGSVATPQAPATPTATNGGTSPDSARSTAAASGAVAAIAVPIRSSAPASTQVCHATRRN